MNFTKEISKKKERLTIEINKDKDSFLYNSLVDVYHLQDYLETAIDVFELVSGSGDVCNEFVVEPTNYKDNTNQELVGFKKRYLKGALNYLESIEEAIPDEFKTMQKFNDCGCIIESIPDDSCLYNAIYMLKTVIEIEDELRSRNN